MTWPPIAFIAIGLMIWGVMAAILGACVAMFSPIDEVERPTARYAMWFGWALIATGMVLVLWSVLVR